MHQVLFFILYTLMYTMTETSVIRSKKYGPQWVRSKSKEETIFTLPKPLSFGDEIIIAGNLTPYPKKLVVQLIVTDKLPSGSPDYNNKACKLKASFLSNFTVKTIKDGVAYDSKDTINDSKVRALITGSEFRVRFRVADKQLMVNIGNSYLASCELKHHINDIKYISLMGDFTHISELNFQYK